MASDAAYENGTGSGGFLVVVDPGTSSERRLARVACLPQQLKQLWGDQITYIAQFELFIVLMGLLDLAEDFRCRRGVWFIDNIAALMALVKGRSNSPSLDQLAMLIHAAQYALRSNIYFEWVPSEANWSDGISRRGFKDSWHAEHGFKADYCFLPPLVLTVPLSAAISICEYS